MKRSTDNPNLIWCDVCTSWRDDRGAEERDGMTRCALCRQTEEAGGEGEG